MAVEFLIDFSQQRLSPEQVVRNFTDTCRGKASELEDVRRNQQEFTITSYSVEPNPPVEVAFGIVLPRSRPLRRRLRLRPGPLGVDAQVGWPARRLVRDRPGERRLREQPLAPVRQRLPRHHHRERRADAAAVQEVATGATRPKVPDDHRAQPPRPLPRRRLRRRPRRGDLPRSHLHLDAGAGDHARPGADEARDELRLQRLRRGLRGVRGAVRVVGRARRHAARADAHRLLVVRLHDRDGLRLELRQHARDPVPLRSRRGGRVAERREDVLALDPRSRARARAGRLLRRRVPGRRPDAGARGGCSSRGSAGAASSSASAWSASSGPPPGTAGSATSLPSTRPSAPPSSR